MKYVIKTWKTGGKITDTEVRDFLLSAYPNHHGSSRFMVVLFLLEIWLKQAIFWTCTSFIIVYHHSPSFIKNQYILVSKLVSKWSQNWSKWSQKSDYFDLGFYTIVGIRFSHL